MRRNCCSSLSSLTELAVGLTAEGPAPAVPANTARRWPAKRTSAAGARRASSCLFLPCQFTPAAGAARRSRLDRDLLAIRGLPAPCAGAVAALHHPLLVDLG